MPKVVNNMVEPTERPLATGDVVIGSVSGDHYVVINNKGEHGLLNLRTLHTLRIVGTDYIRTNITDENITITFEGAKN